VHDLSTVDLIRARMEVGYKEAMEALDAAEGDVVGALAILEQTTSGGLRTFEEKAKEGVTRGLAGDILRVIRWKLLGQEVAEASVAFVGLRAVVVGLLSLLISSSTVETEYESVPDEASDQQPPESH
jgi:hypothetical protein